MRGIATLGVPVVSAMILAALPVTAWAASPVGAYPALTPLGSGGSSAGTARFGVTGFPEAEVASTSLRPDLASGNSAFLGTQTPFGAEFGSSQGKPYYTLYTAAGRAASVTTVTFARTAPAGGWGFALGDIDADTVRVAATGAAGQALPVSALGFRGPFQYCHNSPKPAACKKDKSNDDEPVWNPLTGTLTGNGTDTYGASGWFMPASPVKTLTLTYDVLTGIPAYQLWMAARKTRVTGCVDAADHGPLAGATVRLLDADGHPVLHPDGGPVTTTSDGDGGYAFDGVVPARYRLSLTPPDGYTGHDLTRTVDATGADPAKVACFSATPVRGAPEFSVLVPPNVTTTVSGPLTEIAKHATFSVPEPPRHGVAHVTGNKITYRPHRGFLGNDHLGYCLRLKTGRTECGRITIIVAPKGCRIADLGSPPSNALRVRQYAAAPARC